MGLFNNVFGNTNDKTDSKTKSKTPDGLAWIALDEVKQLDEIAENSKTKTQLIFKHSTRCGISKMAISQFKKDYKLTESQADLFYLDLIAHRDISNAITDRFKTVHESPQLLVIKNGIVVKHESHGGINELQLETVI